MALLSLPYIAGKLPIQYLTFRYDAAGIHTASYWLDNEQASAYL